MSPEARFAPCPRCGHQPDTPNHVYGCEVSMPAAMTEYRVARTLLQVPGVRYTTHADAAAAEREVAELSDYFGGEDGFEAWIETRTVTPWERQP